MEEKTEKTDKYGETRDERGRFIEGNPGKPKGTLSFTAVIKRKLQELSPDGKRDAMEVLADNIIQDALDSSDKMRQLIWNYLDGLPRQRIDISEVDMESENSDIYEE